jgi:osmotically inducible protein OsmC
MADRSASAEWQGDLLEGRGTVSADSSGLFSEAGVTWGSRTESPDGKTSPEELIAAAHAACFCMALSNELSTRGHAPERLQADATCTFAGGKVTTMVIDVTGTVADADQSAFEEALAAAEQSCPVSNALRGNVEMRVAGALS